jgi:hypothetical protein
VHASIAVSLVIQMAKSKGTLYAPIKTPSIQQNRRPPCAHYPENAILPYAARGTASLQTAAFHTFGRLACESPEWSESPE